jgi:hypothetical protein
MKLEKGGRRRPESASGVAKPCKSLERLSLPGRAARASKAERQEAAKERDEARGISSSSFLASFDRGIGPARL